MAKLPPEVQAVGRGLLVGLGRVGARAIASATKSVVKDGQKVVSEVDKRFKKFQEGLDKMMEEDEEELPK